MIRYARVERMLRLPDGEEIVSHLPHSWTITRLWNEALGRRCSAGAVETAAAFDTNLCVNRMLQLYAGLIEGYTTSDREEWTQWNRVISGIEIEWDLLAGKLSAAAAAMIQTPETSATLK